MAWTREEAEAVAREQTAELRARGCFDIRMQAVEAGEYGWIVEGQYSLDASADPIWGPIVEVLGTARSSQS